MRAIFFDLDGTLVRFERSYRDIVADAFRDVCGEVSEATLDAYDEAFFDLFGACTPDPVRRGFARVDACAPPDALTAALAERELAATRPSAEAHATLDRLADEYRLGVLTNGVPDWQARKLAAHGLDEYFDAVVASYEVGAHKPDPAPFRTAEERLPADAYAMVGDADADVEGARSAGWAAHRYTGGGFSDLPDAIEWV